MRPLTTITRTAFCAVLLVAACALGGVARAQSAAAPAQTGEKASAQPIIHISYSRADQWAECVRAVTGHALLFAYFDPPQSLSCPASAAEFRAQLADSGTLVPGDRWDLVIGKRYVPLATPAAFWKSVDVSVNAKAADPRTGSRAPTAAELDQLSSAALIAIRPSLAVEAPVSLGGDAGRPASAIAKISLELIFEIRRLSTDGPESIIGILREGSGGIDDGRLIYGEFRQGQPVFLWDSPRFTTRLLNISYRDLDHDGAEEILLMGFRPSNGTVGELVIFSRFGNEMSRQEGGPEGSATPITTGGIVKFVPGGGLPDLLQFPDGSDDSTLETYSFDRTYKKESDEPPAKLNAEGAELMQSKKYEAAAAKFDLAFRFDPMVAEYANNVGYAWYRAGKTQDAVAWFREAISLDPQRAVAYLNLGDALAKLNHKPEARDAYAKYLQLAPTAANAADVRAKLDALHVAP